jgi:hypothetical protein
MNQTMPTHDDIEELITQAEGPRDKAMLLILLRISQNLMRTADMTEKLNKKIDDHVVAFTQHEKDEMALFNQGRGFLRAIVGALVIFQAIATWTFSKHLQSEEEREARLTKVEVFTAEHRVHHEMEERAKK